MPDLLRDSLNTFGCKLQAEAQMLACFAPHTVSPENPGSHSQRAHAGEHRGEAVGSIVGKQWGAQWGSSGEHSGEAVGGAVGKHRISRARVRVAVSDQVLGDSRVASSARGHECGQPVVVH
eukprot:3123994-Pyramimonas_sp.AAC.1